MAVPGRDQPYVLAHKDVPDSPGLDPVTADIELKRGVWIEGKITDKVTGKPLQGTVEYFALHSNPNLRDYPGFDSTVLGRRRRRPNERGWLLPGRRPAGARLGRRDVALERSPLRAPERDDEFGIKETLSEHGSLPSARPDQLQRPRPDRPAQGGRFGEAGRDARPGLDVQGHGARAGRPAPGRGAELRPGRRSELLGAQTG